MSIPKLAGLETEFAITGGSAVETSRLIVGAYQSISLGDREGRPRRRGTRNPAGKCMGGGGWMLANGARFYVDHCHPEYCTPESADPVSVIQTDRAGDEIVRRCAAFVNRDRNGRNKIRIYKNNSDHLGHSYGTHENYSLQASTFAALFGRRVHWVFGFLTPFLVSRIIFTGAGKVGAENGADSAEFQLSQRADFFEQVIGLETTVNRPIVNTRDEPHADPQRFRRLHVIAGDANLCPYAGWLKVGTMQIFLKMLEDSSLNNMNLYLADPVMALQQVSRDLDCRDVVLLEDGRRWTAVEIQSAFLDAAQRYFASRVASEAEKAIMREWEFTLRTLKEEPMRLIGRLDWVTKRQIIAVLAELEGWGWESPQAARADILYHALDPQESIFAPADEQGVIVYPPGWRHMDKYKYLKNPPGDSRAFLRGRIVARLSDELVGVDWARIQFHSGELQLPDPGAMGESQSLGLIEQTSRASKLLTLVERRFSEGTSAVVVR